MIDSLAALRLISRHRGNGVVVATMSASFLWRKVSTLPGLDVLHSDVMGKTSSLGLGLALALPDRPVVVLDGDGSLLMNLGSLVTIAAMAPRNLIHVVLGNGAYLTSGNQPIPGRGVIDFPGLAAAAGYPSVHGFADAEGLERGLGRAMGQAGPVFVYLKVAAAWTPARARPTRARAALAHLRAALRDASSRIRVPRAGQRLSSEDRALTERIAALRRRAGRSRG